MSALVLNGLLLGLLITQLLGDSEIAARWEELPEVLTTLMFDGLKPDEDAIHDRGQDLNFTYPGSKVTCPPDTHVRPMNVYVAQGSLVQAITSPFRV